MFYLMVQGAGAGYGWVLVSSDTFGLVPVDVSS